MKAKIIAILSILVLSMFVFAGCFGGGDSSTSGSDSTSVSVSVNDSTTSESDSTKTSESTGQHTHTFVVDALTVTPTLTAKGKATLKCSGCNETAEEDVPVLTDATVWTKDADVTIYPCKGGEDTYKSERYGEVKITIEPTAKHTTTESKKNEKPATCTEAGSYTKVLTCTVCGDVVSETEETIPASGHKFTVENTDAEGALKSAATCTESAVYYKSCSVCGAVSNKDTDTFVSGEPNGHTEVVDLAVAATCTVDGKTEGKHCSVCNEVLVAQQVVKAPGHTEVVDPAVAATCTEDGKTEGKHCSVCNAVIVAQTVIPALNHDYGEWTPVDSTKHKKVCSRDASHVVEEDHTAGEPVRENEVGTTCDAEGSYDEVVYCTVCKGEISRTHKTVASLGHNYGNWTPVNETTHERVCTRNSDHKETAAHNFGEFVGNGNGTHTKTCEDCGYKVTENCKGGEATCVDKATCEVCGEKYGDIDPNNHDIIHHEAKEPTCTEAGHNAYDTCSRCDYTTFEEIPATNHTIVTDTQEIVKATCLTTGSHKVIVHCSKCDYVESEETVEDPIAQHNFVGHSCSVCHLADSYFVANISIYGYVTASSSLATLDANGAGNDTFKNTYESYKNARFKIEWVDFAKGQIRIVYTYSQEVRDDGDDYGWTARTEDFEVVAVGYLDYASGIIVANSSTIDGDKNTNIGYANTFFIPSTEIISSALIKSSGNNIGNKGPKAIEYNPESGNSVKLFIYNGTIVFGVEFADLEGNALAANDFDAASSFIVKKDGEEVVAYGKNSEGSIVELDDVHGVYTSGEDTLVLDGLGTATIGETVGAYVVSDGVVQVTVTAEDGKVTAYYEITLNGDAYTKETPSVTITFVVGEGHDAIEPKSVNKNTDVTLPVLEDTETELFKGWLLNGNLVDSTLKFTENTTLTAHWMAKVVITVSDEVNGDETLYGGVGEDLAEILKKHNTAHATKEFRYYVFFDGGVEGEPFESYIIGETDDVIPVKAIYKKDYIVTLVIGNGLGNDEYPISETSKIAEALPTYSITNGYKFDGWFTDPDCIVAVSADAEMGDDSAMTYYAKWSLAGNVKFVQNSYTFVKDTEFDAWKSNNQGVGNSTAVVEIEVTEGTANIEFDFWSDGERNYDYMKIFAYDGTNHGEIESNKGKNNSESDSCHVSVSMTYTTETRYYVRIEYKKGGTGDKFADTGYFKNLKINGVDVYAFAPLNTEIAGDYTADDETVVTVTMGGGVKIGNETVGYTVVSENVIGATFADGYKEITLDKAAKTCVVQVPTVDITYNYGGHGKDKVAKVNKNSVQTVTSEVPTAEGFIFRGWYSDASFTTKVAAGSEFTADSNKTFYAKWDKAVTVTFHYEDNDHADEVVDMYANDSLTVKAVDFQYGDLVFVGWFTKNLGGEFDKEVKTGDVVTDDMDVYAKWIAANPLAGSYHGVEVYGTTAAGGAISGGFDRTYNVDALGNMTGEDTGAVTGYNAETGFLMIGKHFGWYDAVNGILVYSDGNSSDKLTADFHICVKDATKVTANGQGSYWNSGLIKLVTLSVTKDGTASNVTVFVYENKLYYNVTFTSTDSSKTYTAATAYTAPELTVLAADGTQIATFGKSKTSGLVAKDGTEGTFTCEGEADLILNGAGLSSGKFDGTYTAAAEGAGYTYDITTGDGQYKVTISENTYSYVDNRVTISFVNELKDIADMTPFYGKSATLPSGDAVAVEGYKFRGWYETEDFSGSVKTTVTLTENKTYYAKYDAIVDVTFDYGGYEIAEGVTTTVVNTLAVGDTLGNTIPTVASDARYDGKAFAGWFVKNGDVFGDAVTSSTKVPGVVTYYAKWVDAPQSYGTYKGWNMDEDNRYESYEVSKMTIEVFKVDVTGKYSGSKLTAGTLTDEQAAITDGSMVLGEKYVYFNKEAGIVWYGWSGTATSVANDTMIGFDISRVEKATVFAVKRVLNASTKISSYALFVKVDYIDGTSKMVFCYDETVFDNVRFTNGETDYTDVTSLTKESKVYIYDANGVVMYVYENGKALVSDGMTGTYAGEYGNVDVDGYGTLTLNGETISYIATGKNITFIIGRKRLVTISLGEGTYAKVLDGYEGTYTLPDGATTETLDGYGATASGKTYVVSGGNITIYDGEESVVYGIDVANKTFLGKSVFANKTYAKNSSNSITFEDGVDIKGKMILGYSSFNCEFTGTLEGNVLTITITKQVGNIVNVGKTLTFTVSDDSLTLTGGEALTSSADGFVAVGYVYTLTA